MGMGDDMTEEAFLRGDYSQTERVDDRERPDDRNREQERKLCPSCRMHWPMKRYAGGRFWQCTHCDHVEAL
jgi:ribosomal protein L37AE/L43A